MAEREPLYEKEQALQQLQQHLENAYDSDQFLAVFVTPTMDGEVKCHFVTWHFPMSHGAKLVHELSRWVAAETRGLQGPPSAFLPEANLGAYSIPEFEEIVVSTEVGNGVEEERRID